MRRMDYKYLLESEAKTAIYTASYLQGFDSMMPKIINTLLQLSYFCGIYKKSGGPRSTFNSYCYYQYLQIPYSLRAGLILYQSGYYLEAAFILRYLMEIFVKMKYLRRHKNYIQNFWTNQPIFLPTKKGKRRLTLRDIFEEVSPGSYLNYGTLLSNFQHGGVGTLLFRIIKGPNTTKAINMGSNWDERNATFLVNNITMLSCAIINNFPVFFPRGFKKTDREVLQQYTEVMLWLKLAVKDHKKAHPRSKRWYKEVAGLLRKN